MVLLGQEGVASSFKVATLETRLREDQVVWLDLVEFYGSSIMVISVRFYFGGALLFT